MKIEITTHYGFVRNWTLQCYGKQFFLGQDIKFCTRVLGLHPKDIVDAIGTREIMSRKGNLALSRYIRTELGITRKNVSKIHTGQFCSI